MRNKIWILSLASMLAVTPAFAKTDPEFPSRSIRPVVPTAEADRTSGQSVQERRVTPAPQRITPPNPRACARPYASRDEAETADRRDCLPENSVLTDSQIPQLRAFRQPTIQRFAP